MMVWMDSVEFKISMEKREIVSNMDHLSEEAINNIHSPSPTNLQVLHQLLSPTEAPDEDYTTKGRK